MTANAQKCPLLWCSCPSQRAVLSWDPAEALSLMRGVFQLVYFGATAGCFSE